MPTDSMDVNEQEEFLSVLGIKDELGEENGNSYAERASEEQEEGANTDGGSEVDSEVTSEDPEEKEVRKLVPKEGDGEGVYWHQGKLMFGIRFWEDGRLLHVGYIADMDEAFDLYESKVNG